MFFVNVRFNVLVGVGVVRFVVFGVGNFNLFEVLLG